jgi:hypothetical protein
MPDPVGLEQRRHPTTTIQDGRIRELVRGEAARRGRRDRDLDALDDVAIA